jgi:cysteine desulfurase
MLVSQILPIYLDYNACTPVRTSARAALLKALDTVGNPSSVHQWGRAQRKNLDEARAQILDLVDGKTHTLIFTSGGTEANNLAVCGVKPSHIFVSSAAHSSLLSLPEAALLPVTPLGLIDLQALQARLESLPAPHKSILCVSMANHETGVLQDFEELVLLAKKYNALILVDACQALGRTPVSFTKLGVDLMSVSSSKVGGPPGVGALIVRKGLTLTPLLYGGGQESSWRAGTQNTPGICGFAAALQDALQEDWAPAQKLRDHLEATLVSLGAQVYTSDVARLPNTACLHMPGVSAQDQVMAFDIEGFGVSAGSACSSGRVSTSSVLKAMGLDTAAAQSLRISLAPQTPPHAVEAFIQAWHTLFQRARPCELLNRKERS